MSTLPVLDDTRPIYLYGVVELPEKEIQNGQETSPTCSVCLIEQQTHASMGNLISLSCIDITTAAQHVFCAGDINQEMARERGCPNCRKPMSPPAFKRFYCLKTLQSKMEKGEITAHITLPLMTQLRTEKQWGAVRVCDVSPLSPDGTQRRYVWITLEPDPIKLSWNKIPSFLSALFKTMLYSPLWIATHVAIKVLLLGGQKNSALRVHNWFIKHAPLTPIEVLRGKR